MDYEIREFDEDGSIKEEVLLYISSAKSIPAQGDWLELPDADGNLNSYMVMGTIHRAGRMDSGVAGYISRTIVCVELPDEEPVDVAGPGAEGQETPPAAKN